MDIDTWVSLAVLVGGLAGLYWKLSREFKTELRDTRTELKTEFKTELRDTRTELKTEFKGDFASLRTEFREEFSSLRTEFKADIASVRTEVKDEFAVVRADLARLDDRVYVLAAGLRPQIEQARTDTGAELEVSGPGS